MACIRTPTTVSQAQLCNRWLHDVVLHGDKCIHTFGQHNLGLSTLLLDFHVNLTDRHMLRGHCYRASQRRACSELTNVA